MTAAEKKAADAKAEVEEAAEALRRCRERKDPAPAPPAPAYLTLGPVESVVRGKAVSVHAIESVNGTVVRCLVLDAEGRLRWEDAGDVARSPAPGD